MVNIAGSVLTFLGSVCILCSLWQIYVQRQRQALLNEAAGEFHHFVVRLITVSSLLFITSNAAEVAEIEYGVTRELAATADFFLGCCSLMGARQPKAALCCCCRSSRRVAFHCFYPFIGVLIQFIL
jgi:hypothetical protein